MKTSAVLASVLFGLAAVAAPVDKRALVVHTEVVVETVVLTSTVYEGDYPAAAPTPAGAFYEKPKAPSSAAAVQTPDAPAPVVQKPSINTPAPTPPKAPTSLKAPAPPTTPAYIAPSPAPEPAKPSSAPAYVAPAPAPPSSSEAPAAAPTSAPAAPAYGGSTSPGEKFSDVDITIYDNTGGYGACGTPLHDDDMIVAIAESAWGSSTYDTMTGKATNVWCGQKIQIEYKGKSVQATIMDMCPGCSGHDIDLSLATWKALTGLDEKTRLKASWSKIS